MLDIKAIIKNISKLGYTRILVEGGAKLAASLINNDLIDEIAWFRASKIMGSNGINAISNLNIDRINHLKKFQIISTRTFDDDHLTHYRRM